MEEGRCLITATVFLCHISQYVMDSCAIQILLWLCVNINTKENCLKTEQRQNKGDVLGSETL